MKEKAKILTAIQNKIAASKKSSQFYCGYYLSSLAESTIRVFGVVILCSQKPAKATKKKDPKQDAKAPRKGRNAKKRAASQMTANTEAGKIVDQFLQPHISSF